MKKFILIVLLGVAFSGCTREIKKESALKSDINSAIIDGFFDNDTTKVPEGTYFIK